MAKRENILFDKTELTMAVLGQKRAEVVNATYDRINRIQIDSFMERKFLSKIPSEKISIFVTGRENPIVYTKLKEKEFFEGYKEKIREFAKENRITFEDTTL